MSQTSTNIYDTFGNEVSFRVAQDTLVQYIKNSTVDFPLPEASAFILANLLGESDSVDHVELDTVKSRLVNIGFGEPAAGAMATVLLRVAKDQGVDPHSYFDAGSNTLKFTVDAYEAMNALRPDGNRVGFVRPINNARSRFSSTIKP